MKLFLDSRWARGVHRAAPRSISLASVLACGLTWTASSAAQTPPPPVPPPTDDDGSTSSADASDDTTGAGRASVSAAGSVGGGVDSSSATGEATGDSSTSTGTRPSDDPYARADETNPSADESTSSTAASTSSPAALTPKATEDDYETWFSGVQLRRTNTLSGSTGLQRVREAGSGPVGTFRLNLQAGFNSMGGFLCNDQSVCRDPVTNEVFPDEGQSQRSDYRLNLSVTPFPFLEAYASVRNTSTWNSQGQPQLLQILGDWSLGVKGFSPAKPDAFFYYGGDAELSLLNGTGVGLEGGATSFALRGLGTLDFNNRTNPSKRIPLRAHFNLGYYFDNSGAIVQELEDTPAPEGRGQEVERTERYGLDISRVDSFEIGLGVEYVNKWVRPFVEWTAEIPVNRQGHVCNRDRVTERGEFCLADAAALNTSPNRFTLGVQGYPWQATGLNLSLAVDIGAGANSIFLEEVTPEAPYTVWLGLGYAVDTSPKPRVVEKPVTAAPSTEAPVRRFVTGVVVDEKSATPIPDAILRYADGTRTGLVAQTDGTFRSQELPPGEYEFNVFAENYKQGSCSFVVPESAPAESDATDALLSDRTATSDVAPEETRPQEAYQADGEIIVPLTCQLKELPRVANVVGLLVDYDTGGPVPDGTVKIVDKLNRSLSLEVDSDGAFKFQNVPFGTVKLLASAPGYLTTVNQFTIESRKDQSSHLVMTKRPAKLDVRVKGDQIVLDQPIQFLADSSEITADSTFVVEQLAALLKENKDIGKVQIQVHTDDTGAASYSRRLSQERAERIRDTLIALGVDQYRVTAKGFGPDQPLVPNVSPANRAKNNRVEVVVQED